MGERCTIGFKDESDVVLYLHWNSTPVEVTALTDYCAIQGYRRPDHDSMYGMARLCQTACNAWGNSRPPGENGLSVGISPYFRCEEDYGHYVLDGWFIGEHDGSGEFCYNDVDLAHVDDANVWEQVVRINSRQPEHVRIDGTALYCLYGQRAARRYAYRHGDMEGAFAPIEREKYLKG
jgi:hypothetical protein